jgi:hypothetical protein
VTADAAVDMRTEHAIERSVIVLLAGSQAERMALGRAKYLGSGLDFFEVRYAGYLSRTRPEISAYLRWMQLRVHALVESPTWQRFSEVVDVPAISMSSLVFQLHHFLPLGSVANVTASTVPRPDLHGLLGD